MIGFVVFNLLTKTCLLVAFPFRWKPFILGCKNECFLGWTFIDQFFNLPEYYTYFKEEKGLQNDEEGRLTKLHISGLDYEM